MPNIPPILQPVLLFACVLLFAGVWAVGTWGLRAMSGFSWQTSKLYLGQTQIDKAAWASARIGFVNFSGCLHVIRLENGFLLKISNLFLGGSRFVEDEKCRHWRKRTWSWSEYVEIVTGDDAIELYGKAATIFMRYCPYPEESTPD